MYGYLLVLVIIIIAVWAYTTKNVENLHDYNTNDDWYTNAYGNPVYKNGATYTNYVVAARSGKVYVGTCTSVARQYTETYLSAISSKNTPIIQIGSSYRAYQSGFAKYKGQWRVIGEYYSPLNGVSTYYLLPTVAPARVVRDMLGNNYEPCNSITFDNAHYKELNTIKEHPSAAVYLGQSAPEMSDADVVALTGTYNTLLAGGKIDGTFTNSFTEVTANDLNPAFLNYCKRVGVIPGQQTWALFFCNNPKSTYSGGSMYYYNSGIDDSDVSRRYTNLGECALQVSTGVTKADVALPAMFPSFNMFSAYKGWAYSYLMWGPSINPPSNFITVNCNYDAGMTDFVYLLGKVEDRDKYYRPRLITEPYGSGWEWNMFQASYVSNVTQIINSEYGFERNTRLLAMSSNGVTGMGENIVGFLSKRPDLCTKYGITVGGVFDSNWTWVHPRMSLAQSDNARSIYTPGSIVGLNYDHHLLPTWVTNGMNIRDSTTGAIYFVEKGMLRPYPNWSVYVSWGQPPYMNVLHTDIIGSGNDWSSDGGAYIGPPMITNPFPPGVRNGMNVAASGAGIYHIMFDQKRWFDWPTYVSWGQPAYVTITPAQMTAIPTGYKMYPKTNAMKL
jgi:hypothetical protein